MTAGVEPAVGDFAGKQYPVRQLLVEGQLNQAGQLGYGIDISSAPGRRTGILVFFLSVGLFFIEGIRPLPVRPQPIIWLGK